METKELQRQGGKKEYTTWGERNVVLMDDDAHDRSRCTLQLVVIDDSPSYSKIPLKYFLQRFPVDMVVSYFKPKYNIHRREDTNTRFPACCVF